MRAPLLAAFAVAVVAACTRAPPASGAAKHKIAIGITQEPDTLLMQMKQMNASEHVGRTGALLLTLFDEHWQLVPFAAERIPTVANGDVRFVDDAGVERMEVTWRLKDGLFWADGAPVTSDDFVFGQQLAQDPALEIVDRTAADRVLSMRAPDPRTLVVTWKERYAGYDALRVHEALPRHIVEPLWKTHADLKQSAFARAPVCGGAFTIAEWQPGSFIRAVRNPHAVAFKPILDEVTWKIIPQTTALEAALLSGEIDAISVIGLTFDQALDFQQRHGDRFDVRFNPALLFEHIDVNLQHPALKDVAVREALVVGADRASIVAKLFSGKQTVANGMSPTGSPFHVDDLPARAYDPAAARALLDAAGWVVGADGVRAKGGVRLSFPLTTTAGDKTRELVEQILVAKWKAIGAEAIVDNQPAKILFGDTIRHRKFAGLAMFAWSQDPQLINEASWRCDQIPSEANGWRGQNYPGYCNPAVDVLLGQMLHELDDAKRADIGRQIERALAHDLPQLPLYFRVEVSVVPKGFRGWRPTGLLESLAWNAHEWSYAP